jgi:KN motif
VISTPNEKQKDIFVVFHLSLHSFLQKMIHALAGTAERNELLVLTKRTIMTSTAMTSIYSDPATASAGQQHSSSTSNNNNSHSPKHMMTANGKCSCCPYGYHLDLDFVQYCENLKANASSKRNGIVGGDQSSAAVRKRQRKSMEVMLGVELADFSAVWDTVLVSIWLTNHEDFLC